MRYPQQTRIAACLMLILTACLPAMAQVLSRGEDPEAATPVPSRIQERIDDTKVVRLAGNTHPMARAQFDRGLADPQLPMERMVLVLKRSPEQQAALDKLMEGQTDPKSPNFHHWLTPEQFGKTYGPSDSDIAAITNWLQNHGFQIYQVNKGRVTIEFSGTAAQVQQTFHTEMHHYLVNGKMHLANDRDPQIPQALAPVVGGVSSLHDFFPVHQSILGQYVRRDPKTGLVTPVDPQPQYFITNQAGNPQEDITPYDFATIYNLLPLWNAGITGKGQTIAISAVTDINASDVSNFRKTFGLGGFTGTVKQIINGTDPGIVQGALVENTLDTEWSGATAPDANVAVIVSKSTATTFGGELSESYLVNNPSIATIMSASYGGCEIALGTSGNQAVNAIFQQASAEGISVFESSGDQGSTGCDNSDATTFPNPAQYGLQVNGDASSPWVTAVGGTEFTWLNERTSYWTDANSSTNLSDAKGYIPEAPWNGTCTNQMELDRFWSPEYGLTSLEQVCNTMVGFGVPDFVTVTGGSGGVSSCITSTGGEFSTCGGGYAQPSYQKGVTGMPGSKYRYLPDVSLFASSGFPYGFNGSAYLICVASNSKDNTCNYSDNTQIIYQEVGGTSVSSPALAGIMALVQQKQNGVAQGLANPYFYKLYATENLSSCNSSTVAAGNSCIFYDVTYGNNAQVCTTGSMNCVTNTSGDTYGVVSGYPTTTGYDQATGLGSVNATNLVNNWPASSTGTTSATLTPSSFTFPNTTVGVTSTTTEVSTLRNTGTTALTINTLSLSGTGQNSYGASTTCSGSLAAGASCTFTFTFDPQSAGAQPATFSVADSAGTQTVTLSGTGTAASTFTVSLSPTSLTFPSTTVGATSAAQVVTLSNTGTGAVSLTSFTFTGTSASSYVLSAKTCTTSLAAGASCTLSVAFKPASAGTLTASLAVADNATGSPQTVALTGTATATTTTVSLSPTSLTFASTAVGSTSAAQAITLKNTGTAAVTLTSFTFSGTSASSYLLSANTCTSSLAVGASCTLSVAFKPAAAGTLTASLAVADNATGSPQTVALSGTATAASTATVSLTPSAITFPTTAVGSVSAAQTVTLTNTGSTAVAISSFKLTGANIGSFVLSDKTCSPSLAVGASCAFAVTFNPTAAGTFTASVSVADNAAGSPQTTAITGSTGTAGASTLTISPTSVAFPATISGTTSDAQLITLTNSGTSAITLSSIALGGANATSFIELSNCGSSLAASASCTLYVAFKPTTTGALTGTVVLTDNATGSPQSIALTGTGTSAPSVKLSVSSIAFPTTKSGSTSPAQAVTLTNSGTATLNLTSIALGGSSPADFRAIDTCGATLAPSASCTVYVAFAPASTGSLASYLLVSDNGASSPQSVTLTGTGD